jgi:hypothetical protein
MRIWCCLALVVVLVSLSSAVVCADPWPDLSATTPVDWITVTPTMSDSTTWTWDVSLDPGAPASVFAFAVYQPDGALIPDQISGFNAGTTRTDWFVQTFGGDPWEASKDAFGWNSHPPAINPIDPGGSDTGDFWAHWTGDAPTVDDFVYVAHVIEPGANGITYWVSIGGPPQIPEPASIILLGLGGLALFGLRRRKS